MKAGRARLSARYLTALRTHLANPGPEPAAAARNLGHAALGKGMVTLDLAIMHQQAVVALAPSFDFARIRNGALFQAGAFFTEALIPLEVSQRSRREINTQLQQRNATLHAHTTALAQANRRLEREVARRETSETAVRQGRAHYQTLFLGSQIMQKRLRQLTRQILTAQEEERKKISRELHDEVVQILVGINVELSTLTYGNSPDLPHLKDKITRTQRLVEHSVEAVHRFARELRPAVLDDLGLIPALRTYCESLAERKKFRIHLTAFGGVETLAGDKRTVLFRVAQEALTNVARHARATHVRLTISRLPAAIRMEIADNGKSFPVQQVFGAKGHKRLGLVGMRERVEMVGGSLTIESALGQGTTVRAELPFPAEIPSP
ncbi:Oxygen sensor histidine kinase NreB [Lacunisphaera limnophila]|uniref:Oxygen sensor histidine kinase NreB n=2 Tax=Lacunisphaera limnophila TaxID=1838286 RepID=A0A1D8AU62_9BACT|nr:Oxygen sensor histidine kinase NreB [Lacunisphaera limnophila]